MAKGAPESAAGAVTPLLVRLIIAAVGIVLPLVILWMCGPFLHEVAYESSSGLQAWTLAVYGVGIASGLLVFYRAFAQNRLLVSVVYVVVMFCVMNVFGLVLAGIYYNESL